MGTFTGWIGSYIALKMDQELKVNSIELKGIKSLRGLDNLLRSDKGSALKSPLRVLEVPVQKLISGKYQPRQSFNENELNDLTESIRSQGIIQPITVREIGDKYEIVAGERRWRAAKLAGKSTVPIICKDLTDEVVLVFGIIENIQRKDLNPIEEAIAIGRLIKEFSLTHEQVSKSIGKSRTAVTNLLRLLNLTDEVKEMLNQALLEMGHARALLALESVDQVRIAQLIIKRQLSVRESEKLVRDVLNGEKEKSFLPNDFLERAKQWEKRLSGKISLPLQIHVDPKGKGRVVIHFESFNATDPFLKYIENYGDGSVKE